MSNHGRRREGLTLRLVEDSLIPLYMQVMADIRQRIEDGRYRTGDKIPSESDLSEMYHVSRITIRRAIEELASEGLLTKRQGKGTYVNPTKLKKKLVQHGPFHRFIETCAESGRIAGTRMLGAARAEAIDDVAEDLGIEKGSEVICVCRIRMADGIPIVSETTLFPADEYSFIETSGFEDNSVLDTLARFDCRQPSQMVYAELEMVRAGAKTSEELGVGLGEPLFCEKCLFADDEGVPVFLGKLQIVGSQYKFRIF